MTTATSMDPGNLGPNPRPAMAPWQVPNPRRRLQLTLAATLPAVVAVAVTLGFGVDVNLGLVLIWLPLQIITSVTVGRRLYGKKGVGDALLNIFTLFFSGVVAALLSSVLYSVISSGFKAMSWQFISQNSIYITPTTSLEYGGVGHAILGSLIMVGLTTLATVPLGILVAVYLTETRDRARTAVRTLVQAMSGLPSVVSGLFVYSALIATGIVRQGGWLGSLAMLPLMLPTVARVAEEALRLVPVELRNGALALGAPAYRAFLQVTLPAARSGLITAFILGIARVIGETAPLIVAVGTANGTVLDITKPMAALPSYIYQFVSNSYDSSIQRAWGAALMILILVAILFTAARVASSKKPGSMRSKRK